MQAWIKEIEDGVYGVTTDGKHFFGKPGDFLEAQKIHGGVKAFVDAINSLRESIHKIDHPDIILLLEEATDQTTGDL